MKMQHFIPLLAAAVFSTASHAQEIKIPDVLPPVYSKDVVVRVDTSAAPECAPWGEKAKQMAELWYPVVAAYLNTPGWSGPKEVVLEFKDMDGVAHAQGSKITISSRWIKKQPQDIGMVLHELVHVIQGYPPNRNAWWLTEGIADYIRFWHCEPSGQPKIDRVKNNYRSGYRVTGAFLNWVQKTHSPFIVQEANLLLRQGKYTDDLFKQKTGKNLDELWAEFIASLDAPASK